VDDIEAAKADNRSMNLTDYVLDISLISLVLLQIRGRRLTRRNLILPVAISGWAAANYLHGIPTAGNDLVLVGLAAGLGITLGALCGLFTRVSTDPDGHPVAKAGAIAAILWVAGVGTRFAFQLYASHGGGASVGRFSAAHSITSGGLGRRSYPDGRGRGANQDSRGRLPRLPARPVALHRPTEHDGRR